MRGICINNKGYEESLTIGESYEIKGIYLFEPNNTYRCHVTTNCGYANIGLDRFKLLEQIRDEKLNQLGI